MEMKIIIKYNIATQNFNIKINCNQPNNIY